MIASLRRTHRFFRGHAIGGRQPAACWGRWLRWQLGSRLLPYPVEVAWIENSRLVMERGMTGATGNFYCGLHEFSDMALLLHYFGAPEAQGSFLDLGANVGSYTILASAVCGVHSISLEPVPSTFARLMRNLRANDIIGRVDARCIAAGAAAGSLRFSADCDTTNQVVDDGYAGAAMEVQVEPVDNVLGGRIPIPCFWKVDVEGFESQVLKGAAESLGNPAVQVVLLEADGDAIASVMTSHGFQ